MARTAVYTSTFIQDRIAAEVERATAPLRTRARKQLIALALMCAVLMGVSGFLVWRTWQIGHRSALANTEVVKQLEAANEKMSAIASAIAAEKRGTPAD